MRIIGRKNREWYPGAIYHLMERVIRRQGIFKEENDYSIFWAVMKNAVEIYNGAI